MTQTILNEKTDLLFLVRAVMQNYWLFATVIANLIRQFALSQQEKQPKPKASNIIGSEEVLNMRNEYDFNNAKKNPYMKKEKQQITINLDSDVIAYFKMQSGRLGIPYQTLINLYLSDCVSKKRELQMSWE